MVIIIYIVMSSTIISEDEPRLLQSTCILATTIQ